MALFGLWGKPRRAVAVSVAPRKKGGRPTKEMAAERRRQKLADKKTEIELLTLDKQLQRMATDGDEAIITGRNLKQVMQELQELGFDVKPTDELKSSSDMDAMLKMGIRAFGQGAAQYLGQTGAPGLLAPRSVAPVAPSPMSPPSQVVPQPQQPIAKIEPEVVAVDRIEYLRLKAEGMSDADAIARARIIPADDHTPTAETPEPSAPESPAPGDAVWGPEFFIGQLVSLTPVQAAHWFDIAARQNADMQQLVSKLCGSPDEEIPAILNLVRLRAPKFAPFVDWLESRPEWLYETIHVLRGMAGASS